MWPINSSHNLNSDILPEGMDYNFSGNEKHHLNFTFHWPGWSDLATLLSLNQSTRSNTTEESAQDKNLYKCISCYIVYMQLCLCCFGVLSNVLSIIIYTRPSMSRTPINILLAGLSAMDLCLSITAVPAFVLPALVTCHASSSVVEILVIYAPKYVYPLTCMTHTASVWTFVICSVERWHAVCAGTGGSAAANGRQSVLRRRRYRTSAYALLSVCLFSIAYNIVRFFEFRVGYEMSEEGGNLTEILTSIPLLKNSTAYMSVYFVGMFMTTHFAAPFTALLLVNGLTLRAVYVAKQRRRRLLTRRERKEHRTTWMMITICLEFVLCYAMLFVLAVIEAVDDTYFNTNAENKVAYVLNDASNLLVVFNSATTAFIYYIFNRKYRELCKELFSDWCAKLLCCARLRNNFSLRSADGFRRGRSNGASATEANDMSDFGHTLETDANVVVVENGARQTLLPTANFLMTRDSSSLCSFNRSL